MLSRCPFYDICNFTDRMTFGNHQYHCLGSINYDFCQKYKNLTIYYNKGITLDPIEDLNNCIREVYIKLYQIARDNVYIAILNQKGKIYYCDYSGLVNQVDYIKNFTKINFQEIPIGDFLLETNEDNFGFCRISSNTLIAIDLKSVKFNKFESFNSVLLEYANKIDSAIERIEQCNTAILEKESSKSSLYSILYNLKSRLEEDIPVSELISELDNAHKAISQIYAWHPITYEISITLNKLKASNKDDFLTLEEKEELYAKINEWEEKANSCK